MSKTVKKLRYVGSASRFDDTEGSTGLVFEARGEAHEVSDADAERLINLPGEVWEFVSAEEQKAEDDAKQAEAKANVKSLKDVAVSDAPPEDKDREAYPVASLEEVAS